MAPSEAPRWELASLLGRCRGMNMNRKVLLSPSRHSLPPCPSSLTGWHTWTVSPSDPKSEGLGISQRLRGQPGKASWRKGL